MTYPEKIQAFIDLVNEKESDPEVPYWFYNDADIDVPYDEAESLCWDCIHEVMLDAEIGEHFGGGYCTVSDGCEHCEKCEKLLQYDLTDYGVDSELEHYLEFPPSASEPLEPDEAYHLASMANNVFSDEQKAKLTRIVDVYYNPSKPTEIKS